MTGERDPAALLTLPSAGIKRTLPWLAFCGCAWDPALVLMFMQQAPLWNPSPLDSLLGAG